MRYVPTTTTTLKVGDVFNRYTVLGIYKRPDQYPKYALVQCSCGSQPKYVRTAILKLGQAGSCGCFHKEQVTKHGQWNNPLFKTWKSMMERCYKPNTKSYKRYGARGITVCERWHNIDAFIQDMAASFQNGLTIDRIDNNGNYEPSNCRWATKKQQNRNYSRNLLIEYNGSKMCLIEWSEKLNIKYSTLWDRLNMGWSIEKTLTTPVKSQ